MFSSLEIVLNVIQFITEESWLLTFKRLAHRLSAFKQQSSDMKTETGFSCSKHSFSFQSLKTKGQRHYGALTFHISLIVDVLRRCSLFSTNFHLCYFASIATQQGNTKGEFYIKNNFEKYPPDFVNSNCRCLIYCTSEFIRTEYKLYDFVSSITSIVKALRKDFFMSGLNRRKDDSKQNLFQQSCEHFLFYDSLEKLLSC